MVSQLPVTRGKFSLPALTAIVVGSMVGGGVFTLPGSFGRASGPAGAVVAWIIAGAGMFAFARVLQFLAVRKPHLDGGLYIYAKAGFGDYVGFLAVFGYWLAGCMGNCTYWVIVKATLGQFFPVFGDGSTLAAIVVASVGIWSIHLLMLRGPPHTAVLNAATTAAKVAPLLVFCLVLALAWKPHVFQANLEAGLGGPRLARQIQATMLITLYTLLGVEGASIYSRFARKRTEVGRATLYGLLGVTTMLILVTLLPYGVIDRAELGAMRQPSMAGVLGAVIGRPGVMLVSIGLIVSVIGAYLTWSMICAEIVFVAAHTGDMPKFLREENRVHAPRAALWASNALVQAMVISTYWSSEPYYMMLHLTSEMSLAPFLLTALFGSKMVWVGETYGMRPFGRSKDLILAFGALTYTIFLVGAGGMQAIARTAIFYVIGTALYVWARREQRLRVFKPWELAILIVMILIAVWAMFEVRRNGISPREWVRN